MSKRCEVCHDAEGEVWLKRLETGVDEVIEETITKKRVFACEDCATAFIEGGNWTDE